jgi:hypothetical protein
VFYVAEWLDILNGFRNGQGTADNIFIQRQIKEKAYEYNTNLHVLVVGFKQAFDFIK